MAVNWADFEPVERAAPVGEVDWSQFEPASPNKEPGDFSRGFKVAFQQLPQLGYGLAAITASAIETAAGEGGLATSAKEWAVKGYQDWGKRIQEGARETDEFDVAYDRAKEGDFGALVDWLQYGVGYGVGQGAQILGLAGVGAAAGKLALRPVVEKLAGSMVEKEAAKLIAGGMAREAATRQAVASIASQAGALAATGAQAFGMEGGEIGGGLAERSVEEGRTLTGTELARAAGATALAGLYEFAGDALGLGAMLGKVPMGKKIGEMAGFGGRAARAAVAGLAVAPAEGLTEYLQTGVEEYGKGTEENLLPANQSPENRRQALNAAALGAIGGAVMGGAGGVVTGPRTEEKTAKALRDISAAPTVDDAIAVAGAAAAEPLTEADVAGSVAGGLVELNVDMRAAEEAALREAGYTDMERQRQEQVDAAVRRSQMANERLAEQEAARAAEARRARDEEIASKIQERAAEDLVRRIQEHDARGLTTPTAQAYRAALVKRLDELGFEAPQETTDAEDVRGHERQVRQGGEEGQPSLQPGAEPSRGDLQQPAPGAADVVGAPRGGETDGADLVQNAVDKATDVAVPKTGTSVPKMGTTAQEAPQAAPAATPAPTPQVAPAAQPAPAAKEPWQMTQNEYARQREGAYIKKRGGSVPARAADSVGMATAKQHERLVREAIAAGKPVPENVRAEYPVKIMGKPVGDLTRKQLDAAVKAGSDRVREAAKAEIARRDIEKIAPQPAEEVAPVRSEPETLTQVEQKDAEAKQLPEAKEGKITARPTGFPAGGWYAVDENGDTMRFGKPEGEMPRRFDDPDKAVVAGERWRAKNPLTPLESSIPQGEGQADIAAPATPMATAVAAQAETGKVKRTLTASEIPSDMDITLPVKVEETGEVADVEFNAREAFKDASRKIKRLQSLLNCMRA